MRNGFLALALLGLVACGGEGTQSTADSQAAPATDVAAPGQAAAPEEPKEEEAAAPAAEPAAPAAEAPAALEDERTE